jgi:hypothetical protein
MDYATCSHQRYVAAVSAFCLTEPLHIYNRASFQGDDFKECKLRSVLLSNGSKHMIMRLFFLSVFGYDSFIFGHSLL